MSSKPYFRYEAAGARPELGAETAVEGSLGNGPDPGSPAGVRGGWSERFIGRVMTRFEGRGVRAGRTIRDLSAVRTTMPWRPELREPLLRILQREGAAQDARDGVEERVFLR